MNYVWNIAHSRKLQTWSTVELSRSSRKKFNMENINITVF